jgi:uncharacterized membrane protein (UPF0127 family)
MLPLTLAGVRRFHLGTRAVPLACLLVMACAAPAPAATTAPYLELGSSTGTVRVRVEIAETPEARQRGLMGRTSLDEDAGMLFVWPADASSSFFMKDTPLPLSIAFISADGVVLRILDMDPCSADPCPLYDPRTTYRMALEVRQGSFTRWGVREGDRVRVIRE